MKRVFGKLFSVVFVIAVASILLSVSVFAANGIDEKINALKSKYPNGYFWNHKVTAYSNNGDQLKANWDESFSQSVTKSPCKTHKAAAAVGQYDCNFFDGGVQCFGFARRVFYDIFGVRASNMAKRYDKTNVKVGDCIRIYNDTHSAVVIARNGNTLTLVEANLDLAGAAYNCKIRWGATCSVNDITYFHRASNYDSVANTNTNWYDTVVQSDPGTNFSAYIIKNSTWKHTGHVNNNVELSGNTGKANEVWYFVRQSDKSYVIYNCDNNKVLTVKDSGTANDTNIIVADYVGTDNQKWYIHGRWSGEYVLRSKHSNKVFDVKTNYDSVGTNIHLWEYHGGTAQLFAIYKCDLIGTPDFKVEVGSKVKFSWPITQSAGSYTLKIYKGSSATGTPYLTKTVTGTSCEVELGAGSYSAVLHAQNARASSKSAVKTFTVKGASNNDGWTYANSLPSGVTSKNYTIQYCPVYEKTVKTSPGSGWVQGAVAKQVYENSGSVYTSKFPLTTSNTRALVKYEYYHYCCASKGEEVNYAFTSTYTHYDCISNNNVYEFYSHADYEDSRYTFYGLKFKDTGGYVYCNSNTTCDGSDGKHGNRSYYYYKLYYYQDKVAVDYYKYTKQGDWSNTKDSSAATHTVRYKPLSSTVTRCTHKYSNACDTVCNICGAKRSITHSYQTVTTRATLSKNGKTVTKCTVCGTVKSTATIYYPKSIKLSATTYTYNGKTKTPSVTVKDSKGKTLKKGTDYTVTYPKKRKSIGKYTVTVTFKGKYSGTKKLTFEMVPAKVTLSKLTAGTKQLTATWKTVSGATGYEVAYSTSKKFTSKTTKKVTIKKAKTKKTTVKKLSKGKKYYVKVRAYKTVSGKKIYGAYSSVKSVKVK